MVLLENFYCYPVFSKANPWFAAAAGVSVILGAVYMLKLFQHTVLGDHQTATDAFTEVTTKEKLILIPICILVILIGVYPKPLLDISEPAVNKLLQEMSSYTTLLK